jgi:N,N-dimethylformamidase beta subunit-like, C-terminal
MAEVLDHSNGAHALPIRRLAYRDGPNWDPAATLQIPAQWPSGLYVAHVTAGGILADGGVATEADARRAAVLGPQYELDIPFVVRTREPGSQSRILMFVNDTTYEAYNFWGRSLYGFRSFDSSWYTSPGAGGEVMPWAFRVSFRRPFIGEVPFVGKKWTYWEEPLAKWLGRLEIDVEWATLVDLHEDPKLLDAYDMVVSTGHAEYVSNEMYERLQAFIAQGGNAAFFSGNNCWWRIRIEDGGNTMVCYKNKAFDPASAKTINWTEQQTGALVGTHRVTVLSPDPPDGSHSRDDINGETAHFVVRQPAHWVFGGTGLQQDEKFGTFGNGGTVVGYESDVAAGEHGPSWNALADAHFASKADEASNPPEIATMMISEKAGTVFTASTIDWTRGLSQDANSWTAIDQITLNLFVRFGGLGAACDIVGFDSNGAVQLDFTNIGLRSTWDVMLAGTFTRSDRDQIVLYDRAGGALAIVGFDNTGRANLDRTDDTIGSNWTTLVAGDFTGNRRKQVVMYDKSTGDTLLVGFDAVGKINMRRPDRGWRTSWDLITVGPFIGNRRDQVLLYDRAGETADIVGFDNAGNLNLDTSNTGWRRSWDWMVPGHFFGNTTSEVWLCDRGGDFAEILAFDAAGNFRSMDTAQFNSLGGAAGRFLDTYPGEQSNQQQILRWPDYEGNTADVQGVADDLDVVAGDWMNKHWDWLVVGRFRGAPLVEYLRYTAADGTAELYGLDTIGNISRRQAYSGWRSSWALGVSGRFLGNSRDQLALYDRGQF